MVWKSAIPCNICALCRMFRQNALKQQEIPNILPRADKSLPCRFDCNDHVIFDFCFFLIVFYLLYRELKRIYLIILFRTSILSTSNGRNRLPPWDYKRETIASATRVYTISSDIMNDVIWSIMMRLNLGIHGNMKKIMFYSHHQWCLLMPSYR